MSEYEESVEIEIIQILDKIRPFIQRDGGDVHFVRYEEGKVYIRLVGACVGCMALDSTLKGGIESILKEEIPEVEEVINIEDDFIVPEDKKDDIEDN